MIYVDMVLKKTSIETDLIIFSKVQMISQHYIQNLRCWRV